MNSFMQFIGGLSPMALIGVMLGTVTALYLSRTSFHSLIRTIFGSAADSMKLASASLRLLASQIRLRNKEVLLENGRLQTEQDIVKEFAEVSRFVQRDLGGYPRIQRDIQQQITLIQDDYAKSGEVSAPHPEWLEAVEAVVKIRKSGASSNINSSILEQIHRAAELQHQENLKQNREARAERHKILKNMTPYWRKLANRVDDVEGSLSEIVQRSDKIDAHMEKFDGIIQGTNSAEKTLFGSALCQFIIAALVMAIAIGGAFFNFHLIALPMSEMVGSLHRVGGVKVSDIAALVIICLEVTAGIFLLESLRITRLFPMIGVLDTKMRKLIMIGAGVTLITLAGTEAALAFMRDQIAADIASLRASLSGTAITGEAAAQHSWIPLTANMVLGFILPLALTMAAIPLEYLIQTGRTVLGGVLAWFVGFLSVITRIANMSFRHLGNVLIALYDLIIAGPLWLESLIKGMYKRHPRKPQSSSSYEGSDYKADDYSPDEWHTENPLTDTQKGAAS